MDPQRIRQFPSGATRNVDSGRPDPEGAMSPLVEQRFSEYMLRHQAQEDGSLRESDNWQKGQPLSAYMKGLRRHLLHLWLRHRGYPVTDPKAEPSIEDDLCAIIFNAQGYLHEMVKVRVAVVTPPEKLTLTFQEWRVRESWNHHNPKCQSCLRDYRQYQSDMNGPSGVTK